ncbi:MAG: SemiSWEET family sugar transporter [Candidatus Limnocylindrales bacterium]
MSTTDILAVGATIAGLTMAFSPVLQIRRMRRTRSSHDVSLQYMGLLCLGFVLWVAYGVSIPNWVVVGTNMASLSVMVVTILVALRYRRAGSRRAAAGLALETGPKPPPGEVGAEGEAG